MKMIFLTIYLSELLPEGSFISLSAINVFATYTVERTLYLHLYFYLHLYLYEQSKHLLFVCYLIHFVVSVLYICSISIRNISNRPFCN